MFIGTFSYAFGGVSYLILALLLLTSWRGRLLGGLLLVSVVYQSVWSFLLAYHSYTQSLSIYWLFMAELVRYSMWLVLLIQFLESGRSRNFTKLVRLSLYSIIALILMSGMVLCYFEDSLFMGNTTHVITLTSLIISISSLVLIEQIYRNILPEQRWSIKFFCIGLGTLFIYDIYMYSDAIITGGVNTDIWDVRGFVFSLAVPLIAITAARNPQWSIHIFVSRQIVFYSTGIIATGIYLLLMATGAYYIRLKNESWDMAARMVFLFGAAAVWFVVLTSGRVRGKIKHFLTKHFYKNKYDYHALWLSFVDTLSSYESDKRFKENVLLKVANILGSDRSVLFSKYKDEYTCEANHNYSELLKLNIHADEIEELFESGRTIINLKDYRNNPAEFKDQNFPDWLLEVEDAWFVLPLVHQNEIIGFLLFSESSIENKLSLEDHEMLHAVASQVASYLMFLKTANALSESERFETFNRLSAFVVHDIKNQVAQLELLIQNSVKHRDNPDFIDDAFMTVENVARRMQKMLAQLKKARFSQSDAENVNLIDIVNEIHKLRSIDKPAPTLEIADKELIIKADKERLSSAIEHLVQNAQDATQDVGHVSIRVYRQDDVACVEIEDSGEGMTPEFIRERLFKPFDTTKGNAGMGIGVFESREYVQQHEGKILVESRPGFGSKFIVQLPLGRKIG